MATECVKPKDGVPQNKRANTILKPKWSVPDLCDAIRQLQRQRVRFVKQCNRLNNSLAAEICNVLGYSTQMEEAERKALREKAKAIIKAICKGGTHEHPVILALVQAASFGLDAFKRQRLAYEKEMEKLAKQLPVAEWVNGQNQRGFGIPGLAIIVGELGDLNGYPNPGKIWKRMGCAPFESRGEMKMSSTWRGSKPSLSAAEWEDNGYSPRRRAVAFNLGDGLLKQNGGGPYRKRYDEVKLRCQELHPDWKWNKCDGCKGAGCEKCYQTGKQCGHAHNHAHLLMTKLLLKNLWIEWTDGGNNCI